MLLPPTIFDPVRGRIDFFFCLPFRNIPEKNLKVYVKFFRLYTGGNISVKLHKQIVLVRVFEKDIECVPPLTGLPCHTSYEHNVLYRAVRKAERAVDIFYASILRLDEMAKTLEGDLSDYRQRRETFTGVAHTYLNAAK